MTGTARSVVSLALLLVAAAEGRAQSPTAPHPHTPLRELVTEYKRFGLPLPPNNAQLVRIERKRDPGIEWNDPVAPAQWYDLAYQVPSEKPGTPPRYLTVDFNGAGFREIDDFDPTAATTIEPAPGALNSADTGGGRFCLSFAIQAKARGWDDLATALYSLARKRFAADEDQADEMAECRLVAWIYWGSQLTERDTDRREALQRLKILVAEDASFRTPDTIDALRRLERTVAPRTSKPGTTAALIDELTEYWDDPFSFPAKPAAPASYWKLAELGFDAVPELIAHLGDDRLTRASAPGSQWGTGHTLTVGQVCSRLLFNLSARTIGGRYSEANGDDLDPAEARKWFDRAKKVGEEKWLVSHAIPRFVGKPIEYRDDRPIFVGKGIVSHEGRSEPHIVRVIGAKYPDRLPAVYRAMLGKSVEGGMLNDYVNELVASRLTRGQKLALLEEGAASADWGHWVPALEGLARLDRARLRKHLSVALMRVWLEAWIGRPEPDCVDRLVRLAEAADDRACWDALASVAKAGGGEYRTWFIGSIIPSQPPHRPDPHRRERVRFLSQFLDDRTTVAEENEPAFEVRDFAACHLAALLGFPVRRMPDLYRPVYDNDRGPVSRLVFRALVRRAAEQLLGRE